MTLTHLVLFSFFNGGSNAAAPVVTDTPQHGGFIANFSRMMTR